MNQGQEKKKIKFRLFSGLGRTLTISFLLFALGPMTAISLISYYKAFGTLKHETGKALENVAVLKTREISAYFNNMLAQIRYQSGTEANARLLQELEKAYKSSNTPLKEFVRSYKWSQLVDTLAEDIKNYRKSYNYMDIFLIAKNGDILFTVAGESDLGTNLFTDFATSKFAASSKKSIEAGNVCFSDYEYYSSLKNRVYGFITAPVVSKNGDRIGIIAFQFLIDPITRIMKSGLTLGRTAETYLVGQDLSLRSEFMQDSEKALIGEKILTEQTSLLKHHIKNFFTDPEEHGIHIYTGPHGREVVGIHREFMIQDVIFGVIAEIEKAEAFSAIYMLRNVMISLTCLTGLLAFGFVVIIVRRIVRPVIRLSASIKRVVMGDYSQLPEIKVKNEIGDLVHSFNAMTATLKKNRDETVIKEWHQIRQMELSSVVSGKKDIFELSRSIITFLVRYLNAEIGAIYIAGNDKRLKLTGSYAFSIDSNITKELEFGQGLVGQAARSKKRILVTDVPKDYTLIRSGLGKALPCAIVIKPFTRDNEVLGVIELGALEPFSEKALDFLDRVEEYISVNVQTFLTRDQMQNLLDRGQAKME
ncbi:MAG: GAF domain-containing protein [Desulfobacteraceae bacterium]|jgi:HAMP domain-containing protein/putative methionine-R-sulfoxide reductase with GAF domain